ncbi:MAG: ATP-binding protein, partial [Peptococcaceae bacterium]|nr:ATP-binding protein [Peptococcaceae bacterium]
MSTSIQMLLESHAKVLRLPTIAKHYQNLAREAENQNCTYEEYLCTVLEQEVITRRENQLKRRLKQAKFPLIKTLDSFDFDAQPNLNKAKVLALTKGEFVDRKENLFFIGNPGTGKTHLATAVAMA